VQLAGRFLSASAKTAASTSAWKNTLGASTRAASTSDQTRGLSTLTRSGSSLLNVPISSPPITVVPRISSRPVHTQSRTDPNEKTSAETLEQDRLDGVKHFMHPHLRRLNNGPSDRHTTNIVAVNASDVEARLRHASTSDSRRVLFVHGGDPKKEGPSPSKAARAFKELNPDKRVGLVINPHLPPEAFIQEVADKIHADFLHTEPIANIENLHPSNKELLETLGQAHELHVGVNMPGVYRSLAEHTENVNSEKGGHAPDPGAVLEWALKNKIHTYSQAVPGNLGLVNPEYIKQQAEQNPFRKDAQDVDGDG
jgi:hypothetical protein